MCCLSAGHHDLDLELDCNARSFHCDEGSCIDRMNVCDFHSDCPLGEDEGVICGEYWLRPYKRPQ